MEIACKSCGQDVQANAQSCGWCGQPLITDHEPRPWYRWMAKAIDIGLSYIPFFALSALLGIVMEAVSPGSTYIFDARGSTGYVVIVGFGIGYLIMFMVLEAWLISLAGRTPGKALMNIRVVDAMGGKLGFGASLKRSFQCVVMGMGLTLPVISLITQIVAYNKLNADGYTYWDKQAKAVTKVEPVGDIRFAAAVLLVASIKVIEYILNFAERMGYY